MKSLFKFLKQNFWLLLILVLAAFLRIYRIGDYLTFLGDEGRDVLVVYNILHGRLTLLGPTSSVGGFFLGPIYYYFMAPFLWLFNYNPVGPAVMVALFGILTVWLLYKFTKVIFNQPTALIAAAIYAISPIVIAYSRSSWNPNPLPFFSLLIIFLLYKNSLIAKTKYFVLIGFLLGIAMQLHYLSLFLAVVIFLYVLLMGAWTKTRLLALVKQYLMILGGFLVGWSPFLLFEIRHGFPDFIHIFDFILHSGNTGTGGNWGTTVFDVFFRLFARLVFAYPQADQLHRFSTLSINLWFGICLTVAVLSVILVLKNLKAALDGKKPTVNQYLLLTVWLLVGVGLFGFYKKAIYEYYFAFMFPLPFILIANLIYRIKQFGKNKLFMLFSCLAFILLFAVNIQGLPFRYEPNRQLKQMQTIADFIMTKTDAKPFNFALITGGNSDHAYRYFFTVWNHAPVVIDEPAKDPKRETVTDQLFVVCESLPCQPLGNSLWEIAGFGRAEIAGQWKVSVVEIYKLVHYQDHAKK